MELESPDVPDAVPTDLPGIPQRSKKKKTDLRGRDLSEREQRVATLTAQGLSLKQIAHKEGVCVKTIKARRSKIFKKIGQRGVVHLTRYAIRQGWMEP